MTRSFPARPAWIAIAVALLAAAVYANSVGNGFALDDEPIVRLNERVHGVDRLGDAFSKPYWPDAPARIALYRPVTTASYAVEWSVWDGEPWGFHLTNVVLHATVSVAVFALVLTLGAGPVAAGVGAAVFAVHPVHTEAVANVVGRAELLATLFFLAACLLYLRGRLHPALRLPGLAAAFFLALGSKEIAVMLPAVLVLLEAARVRAEPLARRLWAQAPAFVAVAAGGLAQIAFRTAALGVPVGNDAAPGIETLSWLDRLATAARVWPEYVRLLFFPAHLVADYSPGVILPTGWSDPRAVLGAGLAAAALLSAALLWRRQRTASLAILWFPLTVFPVSNLLVVIGVVLAERTLYLPSVAVAIGAAAAAGAAAAWRPRARRLAAAALAGLLLLGAARSWTRNPVWYSSATVLDRLASDHPESFRVQWAVAQRLLDAGRADEAVRFYRYAADLVPTHYTLLVAYGKALVEAGRPGEAVPVLRRAIALVPEHGDVHVLLSTTLMNQGRLDDAIPVIAAGLRSSVGQESALYSNLAFAHGDQGHWQRAVGARRASIALADTPADWQYRHLASLLERLDREEEAAEARRIARSLTDGAAGARR